MEKCSYLESSNTKAPQSDRCESSTDYRSPSELPRDLLVEVICERYHCVMYDYAITTVDFVAEEFGDLIRIEPVVRRGNKVNAERYMELCRINGRHLSVPTILINGKVVFTDVPTPDELRVAIKEKLLEKRNEE